MMLSFNAKDIIHQSSIIFKEFEGAKNSIKNYLKDDNSIFALWSDAFEKFKYGMMPFLLLGLVSPDENIRKISADVEKEYHNILTETMSDNELYLRLKFANNQEDMYYKIIQKFELNGSRLEGIDRDNYIGFSREVINLIKIFEDNIANKEPENITLPSGNIIENNAGNIFHVLIYFHDPIDREKAYESYINQLGKNLPILLNIVDRRNKISKILGYDDYFGYRSNNNIISSSGETKTFLISAYNKIYSLVNREMTIVGCNKISDYYYLKENNNHRVEFGHYFPLEKTFRKIMNLCQLFFDVIALNRNLPAAYNYGSSNVLFYEIYRQKKKIAEIIYDPFQKNNIPFEIKIGIEPYIIIYIATDFDSQYLDMKDLESLFHELGHALHDILNKHKNNIDNNVDFIEIPSYFFEIILYHPKILNLISDIEIDDIFYKKIIKSKFSFYNFNLAMTIINSLNILHIYDGVGIDHAKKIFSDLMNKYLLSCPDGHGYVTTDTSILDYGPQHYTYVLGKILSIIIYDHFAEDPLDSSVWRKYRESMLEPGDTVHPKDMLRNFLGKDFTIEDYVTIFNKHFAMD